MKTHIPILLTLALLAIGAHAQAPALKPWMPPPPGTPGTDERGWPAYPTLGVPASPISIGKPAPKVTVNARVRTVKKIGGAPPMAGGLEVKTRCAEPVRLVLEGYFFAKNEKGDSILADATRELASLEAGKTLDSLVRMPSKTKLDGWYMRALWGTVRVGSDASNEQFKTVCENDAKLAALAAELDKRKTAERMAGIDPLAR